MLISKNALAMIVMLQCPLDPLADDMLMLFGGVRCFVAPFPLHPDLTFWHRPGWLWKSIWADGSWKQSRRADTRDLGQVDRRDLMRSGGDNSRSHGRRGEKRKCQGAEKCL